MTLSQVTIPVYDGTKGNYMPGRQGVSIDTIVYHWIDGTLAVADKVFTDPSRIVSAHFASEDGFVHQYVKLQDTAFHAGRWKENLRSVGIENSAEPGRDASDDTYEGSAQVVFTIARQLRKKVADFQHIPHNAVIPTQCPGTIDIARIVARAQQLEAEAAQPQTVLASSHTVPTTFWVTVQTTLRVRDAANTTNGLVKFYAYKDDRYQVAEVVEGEDIGGNSEWLLLTDKTAGNRYMWSGGVTFDSQLSNS